VCGVGRGVERIVGLDDGVGVVRGRLSTGDGVGRGFEGSIITSPGVGIADGLGRGVKEGDGEGVGVGVFKLALKFILEFDPLVPPTVEFALKLKFESKPVLVFKFAFWFRFALTFTLPARPLCKTQNKPAPTASTATVPIIVRKTTRIVFCFGGG
jgi:hypothetical protein